MLYCLEGGLAECLANSEPSVNVIWSLLLSLCTEPSNGKLAPYTRCTQNVFVTQGTSVHSLIAAYVTYACLISVN